MFDLLPVQAFLLGIACTVSLPLGALLALVWTPRQRLVAAMLAFGGGALLAALTLDLAAESLERGEFHSFALGCISGGIVFVLLNQVVNKKGGFLRKAATTINYLKGKKVEYYKHLFERLSKVHLFSELPPEEIQTLLPFITQRTFTKGSTILRQGEAGDSLFLIEEGEVDVVDEKNAKKIATLKENDVVGEMALVTGQPRSATAVAVTDTRAWVLLKEHFDRILSASPKLALAVKNLVKNRIIELHTAKTLTSEELKHWVDKAVKNIDEKNVIPTDAEIKEAASEHSEAPFAIWLGNFLDNVPEALVIGANLLHASVSTALMVGLFLSNFPEALSAAVGMRQNNYPAKKIIVMWGSLMIIGGFCAALGNVFFAEVPHYLVALLEGVAAGAMLTMIAETMLPEAYYKGGGITGFSTLVGFLAAIFFKTLE
jgi:CRP-like cAMP-binding protein